MPSCYICHGPGHLIAAKMSLPDSARRRADAERLALVLVHVECLRPRRGSASQPSVKLNIDKLLEILHADSNV